LSYLVPAVDEFMKPGRHFRVLRELTERRRNKTRAWEAFHHA